MSSLTATIKQPSITSKLIKNSPNQYSLVIEPLSPGFGHTLGNLFRRVFLSSVPGFAVTEIKINDITHEYQIIPGIVQDALDVVLNLKSIRATILNTDESVSISLKKSTEGDVFASDFNLDSKKVSIANPELFICSINKGGAIDIEIKISRGIGYLPVERVNLTDNVNPQNMLVDALFSPITNVSCVVDDMRVGEMTNYNRLTLNFNLDETSNPSDVVKFTMDLILELYQNIRTSFDNIIAETINTIEKADLVFEKTIEPVKTETTETLETQSTAEIKLPKKILAILHNNNIETNQQLISKQDDLDSLAGIDEKMIANIQKYIKTIK